MSTTVSTRGNSITVRIVVIIVALIATLAGIGHAAAAALGQSLDIIIPERLQARHWEGYRRLMAGAVSRYGAGALLSVPALRADGTQLSVEFTIGPVRSARGDIVGLIAVMRDTTARFEETRALKQKLRSIAETAPGR